MLLTQFSRNVMGDNVLAVGQNEVLSLGVAGKSDYIGICGRKEALDVLGDRLGSRWSKIQH